MSKFCTGVCEEKRQFEGGRRSEMTCAHEAEESVLLEAVCKETAGDDMAGWERLSRCCGDP
jgi:hypothetical protein